MPILSITPQIPSVWRPSVARRIVVDGFVPQPRGGVSQAPSTLAWPQKDPADVLDYELDIGPAIIGNEGDGIATVTITITPNGVGDLAASNIAADGSRVVFWLSAGVAGTIYVVNITVGTINGRILHRQALLPVQLSSLTPRLASALTTNAGATITDQYGNPVLLGS